MLRRGKDRRKRKAQGMKEVGQKMDKKKGRKGDGDWSGWPKSGWYEFVVVTKDQVGWGKKKVVKIRERPWKSAL